MRTLEAQAIAVSLDELAMSLYEYDALKPPRYQEWHRFQQIRVIRHDRPATYEWNMGPRALYNRGALYIPAGVIHTTDGRRTFVPRDIPYSKVRRYEALVRVGRLMEIADEKRAETPRTDMLPPPVDIAQAYIDYIEEQARWRSYRSTLGPGGQLVRAR